MTNFTHWNEALEAVTEITRDFEQRWDSPTAVPFFRGHSSTRFKLLPGLLRQHDEFWHGPLDEGNFYYEFRLRGGTLLESVSNSWDLIFLMQHHGVPTRLLDWTESFAAALFFALEGAEEAIDIWFLDPYTLNKEAMRYPTIIDVECDLKETYYDYFIAKDRTIPAWSGAIAIYPRRRIHRLLGQSGVFTLHSNGTPLEEGSSSALERITLSGEALEEARGFLKACGINDFSLFPDLDGLARFLKKRFRPRHRSSWIASNPGLKRTDTALSRSPAG